MSFVNAASNHYRIVCFTDKTKSASVVPFTVNTVSTVLN